MFEGEKQFKFEYANDILNSNGIWNLIINGNGITIINKELNSQLKISYK
jgi:hypothetical protein